MNSIQKMVTKVTVLATLDELRKVYPHYDYGSQLRVFGPTGRMIFEEEDPLYTTLDMLAEIIKVTNDISYHQEETKEEARCRINLLGEHFFSQHSEDNATVTIETWGDDQDKHYDKIDFVKEHLYLAGFQIEGGQCKVTMIKDC